MEKELEFKLTLQEADTVILGLSKLSYEVSANLINKLQQQAQPQLSKKDDE